MTTLADVAALAGVSVATASKALNNRQQVAPTTRQRVVEAAEQLRFRPNTLAKSLLTGRSGTIGLVTHDLDGRFSIPVLMGVEDAAGTGKMSALLCDARGDSLREAYHLQALLGRRVDGLVVVGARPDPRESLGRLPVPVVYAYAPSLDPEDMSVTVDHEAGGRIGVEHLIACGRSRIAVISGDPAYGAAHQRATGALAALGAAGLAPWGGEVLFGSWTESWGRSATEMFLARPDARDAERGIDGILCGSDQIARGVLDVLRERGVAVPREVSVVSHDNWELFATGSRPQLTSVDMHLEDLGRRAANRLFEAIEGRATPGIDVVPSSLVMRESSLPTG
ncbi:LacI family DNA-binding transcriptional regulator [Serinibacter arcticus]|uniref:LacI family DNA-binding transcriptional regulator n=1 Tax=Serinibacter arcticus TaxID=1655435 RepID=UPI002FCE4913